jgi:hypothetical protein
MSTRPRVLVLGDPQGWALLGSRFDATPVRDVPTADAALIVSASGRLDKATVGAVLAARARRGWVGDWRGDESPRFQPPPIEPCVRFSRTRLTDALHRRRSTGARQGRFGLGATTIPFREISPSSSRDPKTWANPQASPRLCRLARNSATRITA